MKRISKNKIEFDCIIRSVNQPFQTTLEDAESIEVYVNYFDREDDISLVLKGHYKAEYLEKLQQAYQRMETVKITIEVSGIEPEEKYHVTVDHSDKDEDVDI
jgi:Ni,Fe-hydrogenase III small subunit